MRYVDANLGAPGRWMLAAGLIGFGLVGLYFQHSIDGLQPFDLQVPWVWLNSAILVLGGIGLAWNRVSAKAALVLWGLLTVLLFVHAPGLVAEPADPVRWVSAMEVLGLLAACMLVAAPARTDFRLAARIAVGLMLIVFGAVHWLYADAVAGMIPDWMPGRAIWPLFTGTANIAAGLAIASGVLARPASALVGAMFASWIVLVHAPRLLAAPGERSEWVAGALAFALTGVAWTVNGALHRSGGDLQSRSR
ncbi:MAG: DoxX family membrane protein [Brevundimonas sp.]|uniref:DoxX family protein n=1 Tax=Brevundimonas sp. TaxID=1871086 RepID=UPI002486D400|nr:DoxX family membrane protein [Brevundimonas sp.]MDI1327326.1 DoxX family membrane protein [Brevundimonas sp.]